MLTLAANLRLNLTAHGRRCLATASVTTPSSRTKLGKALDDGLTLDDFIAGDTPSRVVLGNTKGCVSSDFFYGR